MSLVAVVTPVYNGGKFLAQTMRAVQEQTYRPLLHIVLDNASTDDTADIISSFQGHSVPLLNKRNLAKLPAARNWSEAVRLVPMEAKYFKILCADDTMEPDAIANLIAIAQSADDVRAVIAMDRFDGRSRWHNMPTDSAIFESTNVLARIFSDMVDVPYHHMMYRTDVRDLDHDFFDSGVVAFDIEAAFRVLAGGGRCGFLHQAVFGTADHAGSLTSTWTHIVGAEQWEYLTRLERFGPATLSSAEYRRVMRRHLLRFYRRLIWRYISGRADLAKRDMGRLVERGYGPSFGDLIMSIATWPSHLHYRKVIWRRPHKPWPETAVKPASAGPPGIDDGVPSGIGSRMANRTEQLFSSQCGRTASIANPGTSSQA